MKTKTMSALLACIVLVGNANARTVKFGTALKEGKINFSVNPSGYPTRNMAIQIHSTSNEPVSVELEPGRIFLPDDKGVQPYVVTRPAIVALDPNESKNIFLYARCGNSVARCPNMNDHFNKTKMGGQDLTNTLMEMNSYKLTDPNLYQQVVWHYTNNLSLSTLNFMIKNDPVIKTIIEGICKRDNKDMMNYSKSYKPSSSGNDMEFSNEVEKIQTELNVVLEQPADLKVALLDKSGQTVKVIGFFMQQPTGQFMLPIELIPAGYSHGDYSITLTDQENKTLEQIPIQI
jgi:hypothetical protein